MEVNVAFYATILVCVTVPPLVDRLVAGREKFRVSRRVGAYALMILFALGIPMFISNNIVVGVAATIVGVGLALYVDRVSVWGTGIVLLVATIVFPASVLYEISIHSGVKDPLPMILRTLEWHTYLAPLIFGVVCFLIFKKLSTMLCLNR